MLKINKVDSTKIYTRQEATKAMGISNDSFSKYFANSALHLSVLSLRWISTIIVINLLLWWWKHSEIENYYIPISILYYVIENIYF